MVLFNNIEAITFTVFLSSYFMLNTVFAEIFTSMVGVQSVLSAQSEMAEKLDSIISFEREKLDSLERISRTYRTQSELSMGNLTKHMEHPVSAYLFMRGLVRDWGTVNSLLENNKGQVYLRQLSTIRDKLPSEEDLHGAAKAIIRLQDTYKISTKKVSVGNMLSHWPSLPMSADDCFELGHTAYASGDFEHAIHWMKEALRRWDSEDDKTVTRITILDHLAFSVAQLGYYNEALQYTKEYLSINPDNKRLRANIKFYVEYLRSYPHLRTLSSSRTPEYSFVSDLSTIDGRQAALCRGEKIVNRSDSHKLFCYYRHNNDPRLLLQPIKTEVIHLSHPESVILYDIISSSEINRLKEIATPRLNRATVVGVDGKLTTANYRIQKSAWFVDGEDIVISHLSQRIEAVTGLDQKSAEPLQIANYGLGGHYSAHYDFATENDMRKGFKFSGDTGNRIATVLLYMSDVKAGGSTVFPDLGLKIDPVKGSAVFWFNLRRNGEGEVNTVHAACPVLAGSKWVSNKWIHERGQEFKFQCGLTYNSE